DRVRTAFLDLIHSMRLPAPDALPYASGLRIFRVCGVTPDMVERLAGFVGTQSLGAFPQFRLFAQYIPQGSVTAKSFPQPEPGREYPVVGLIDSGTDRSNPLLQAWVLDRDEEDVPAADQDNNHGSFVAGLIINGRALNHGDARFPACQAKIVDVVAMPKENTAVYEDELLQTIRRAVKKYRDVKVWNLSVSRTDAVCRDSGFSDFGVELDAIQDRYGVLIVTCAGNYDKPPLRGWPPEDLGEKDRVFPPADGALGVTVGSIAHLDRANSRVRKEQPSPFSRRGPGAAFLPKPDVCHYGGNCSEKLDYQQVGILSVDGSRHVAEAIGTSFSTPLVSSTLAGIQDAIADPVSRNLAKALLVQSAALRGGPVEAPELRYRGFGIPGDIEEILTCAPWQATLILEPRIDPNRRIFAREDFPIPACFRRSDGRVEGEFLMALAYDPPLDPAAGAEYCQINVDVSLGTYDPSKQGSVEHHSKIPLEPRDYGKLYERYLVEYGFKWSPVKVYRARLSRTSGQRWRIYMRMHYRAGLSEAAPQNAALVITMFDPKRHKPVYDDVVQAMNRSGWLHQDLRVSERVRIRA
ncbi:MAG: S8 family serine peptidase, partial [Phycisphaerae bacterium]